ncbi:DUF3427 domain-containing protein [Exiguobacterium oxidotolerans]|uniref:Restriction endonuclease subunit R n=1 Tax=Exiguobacterium oxidotolerans TaxID=223958 RepID=A0A653I8R6_9BACL|nr:DUF3427 domain-containing protein [Exiguobacterium oxidotolerans]VWX35298.1 conserved hypothetical protein [Exiguobacterium oxidotolerans]
MSSLQEQLQNQHSSTDPSTKNAPIQTADYTTELLTHLNELFYKSIVDLQQNQLTEEMIETTNRWLSALNEPSLTVPLQRQLTASSTTLPLQYEKSLRAWDLIAPGQENQEKLLHHLIDELATAQSADWMVSFTRHSGIQALVPALQEAERLNKPIRVLTSFYMNITEAKALRTLMQFRNVEIKIYEPIKKNQAFHPKAYLFTRETDLHSAIIGSSNLSKSALTNGLEWNVRIPHSPLTSLVSQAQTLFTNLWTSNEAITCTTEILEQYEQHHLDMPKIRQFVVNDRVAEDSVDYDTIHPNEMQLPALEQLHRLRLKKQTKAMVIAATGTGKTYLAAFDVKQFEAKRVLFIAHRGKLLTQAEQTFKKIFTDSTATFGRYQANQKETDKQFTFATIQTFSKEVHLEQFDRSTFDYIIIDEFHHAASESYQKVLSHFTPQFLLGITATPERMDGLNIFKLVDHNIAYEIRLYDALAQDLLTPFHYFGIQDDEEIDYEMIPQKNGLYIEKDLVQALERSSRTEYILEMINKFGNSGSTQVGLGFCVNINHAEFMAAEFNKHHIEALAITSNQSEVEREQAIQRLEDEHDPLSFIFTVDLFNEGVDIPKINLMLFLRPTESPTIFIQQLGRGLRKHDSKEYVTILDFIGNSQRAFVAPLVLSGQQSFHSIDRYHVANAVQNHFPILPEGSLAILDRVTENFIIEQMKKIEFSTSKQLRESYQRLTTMIGDTPSLNDLVTHRDAPAIEAIIQQWKSVLRLKQLEKVATDEELSLLLNPDARKVIEHIESWFPIREPFSLLMVQLLLNQETISVDDVIQAAANRFAIPTSALSHRSSLIQHLFKRWSTPLKNDRLPLLVVLNDGRFQFSTQMTEALSSNEHLASYLSELIQAGLHAFEQLSGGEVWLASNQSLISRMTYNRSVIQRLLESPHQEGSWREGVAQAGEDYVLFVNLHKNESIEDQLNYQDYFIDKKHFHWQSQSIATAHGKAGELYRHHQERGIKIHLFIRKAEKEQGRSLPFTYFGELIHKSSQGSKPINVEWILKEPLTAEEFISWKKLS